MSDFSEGTDIFHLYSPESFGQHSTSIVIDFGSGLLTIWKDELNKVCVYIYFPYCDGGCA